MLTKLYFLKNGFVIFPWAVVVGGKGGLMAPGAVGAVASMWAVTSSMWDVTASMYDVQALCGLLKAPCGLLYLL